MEALALQEQLPTQLRAEIARLHSRGFSLLPLDGKRPLVRNWAGERLALGQVIGPMSRVPSLTYGVRLNGLAVVDLDEDDPALVTEIESRFGKASIHVASPRGLHLYYGASSPIRCNLRSEGLPVDIKSGPSSYAVGPYSVRPDSGEYLPLKGTLGDALNIIKAPLDDPKTLHRVQSGNRNRELVSEAIRMIEYVDDTDELAENLAFFRDTHFERSNEVTDKEVRGVAQWAWEKRLNNSIFAGRNSSFRVSRPALDALKGKPNASDAIALYTVLTDLHGHKPNQPFPLVWDAMKEAGHTELTEKRFRRARDLLKKENLLHLVGTHRAGTRHQTFRLSKGLSPRGEGLYLTYVGRFRPGNSEVGQHD